MLGRLGAAVIDADALARDATGPGERTLGPIRARFGRRGVRAGRIARPGRAGARSCSRTRPRSRTWRRSCIPGCASWSRRPWTSAAASGAPFAVVEAIKLVEGGLAERCDEVWLVDCPEPMCSGSRMVDRGMAADDIDRRLAAQAGLRERLASRVTRTLDTSGTAGRDTRPGRGRAGGGAGAGRSTSCPSAP